MRNIKLNNAEEFFIKARLRFVKDNPNLNPTYERIVIEALKVYADGN